MNARVGEGEKKSLSPEKIDTLFLGQLSGQLSIQGHDEIVKVVHELFHCRIVMKGLGYGKQTAVRALTKSRLKIMEIHEQTAVPHNGCRAPKRRRI